MVNIRLPIGAKKHSYSVDMSYEIFSIYQVLPVFQFKMQGNCVELTNSKYKIYSTKENEVIYEIDLSQRANENIILEFYTKKPQKIGGKFTVGEKNYTAIRLKELVEACAEGEKEGLICSFKEEDYRLDLWVDISLKGSVVSIKCQTGLKESYIEMVKKNTGGEANPGKYKSRLRCIEFKGMFGFDVNAHIRDLLVELQKCDIDYTIERTDRMIVGHAIDVPCLEIKTKRFVIVVCGETFLEAHFSREIWKATYCINHLGERFNVYERMATAFAKNELKCPDLGVDSVWRFYHEDSEYPVSLGYNV